MDHVTIADLLLEFGHDLFMIATWLFTALTLFVVGLALYRLAPRRPRDIMGSEPDDQR